MYEYWTSLDNFIPKYSALYHAFVHRIVFLISFLDSSLLVYKNTTEFGWLSCVLQFAKLVHLLALVAFLHGEGDGTPLQYSCLENPMDGGAWWAAIDGVTQSRIRLKWLSSSSSSLLAYSVGFIIYDVHSCSVVSNSLWPHGLYSPPGSSVHGDSPGKNSGVDCHAPLQGIFPTQGLNPDLLHCRRILYHLSHQRSPYSVTSSANKDTFFPIWIWLMSFSCLISLASTFSKILM